MCFMEIFSIQINKTRILKFESLRIDQYQIFFVTASESVLQTPFVVCYLFYIKSLLITVFMRDMAVVDINTSLRETQVLRRDSTMVYLSY